MATIPLRLLVPGRVYKYRWRGIDQSEEQRKKLIPPEILPLEPLQIGHIFQDEGLFMYLEKNIERGYPVPVGYVNKFPRLGFKGETPEEYIQNNRHENMKAILPPSSFVFSELERPAAPPPPPASPTDPCAALLESLGIKTDSDFRKWSLANHPDKGGDQEMFKKVSGCFKSGGRRKTKRNRRRRATRKRV